MHIASKWFFSILVCFATGGCLAQNQVKIIGQFTGAQAAAVKSVSLKAHFLEKGEQTFPVSGYGSFSGTVEAKESGLCTLAFKNYSYDFVIASEPVVRIMIETQSDGKMSISLEDSKENDAYKFAKILMNDQFRMYSYFAGCKLDSCVFMMRTEEVEYRHNRDSIVKLYPGTYAAEVLCRFYDIHAPAEAKLLSSVVKEELLNQTPWQLTNAYNSKVISRVAMLYLDYAPDTGTALMRSIKKLLDKTQPGSLVRNRLANVLFDIFVNDTQEDGLKQFLTLTASTPGLFTDLVLKEKCGRYAKIISGEKAPEINLPDSTGKEISLQDIAAGHEYTLLVFWNPDCEHCIAAMRIFREAYKKYHLKGLEIFAVSLNSDKGEWLSAIEKNRCNWINVKVNEKNKAQPEQYFITYTPKLVLINKQGLITKSQMPVEELMGELKELFVK